MLDYKTYLTHLVNSPGWVPQICFAQIYGWRDVVGDRNEMSVIGLLWLFIVIGCVDGHYNSQCIIAMLSALLFCKLMIFR